ncbi:hypothetical protein [Croceicoccus gelatinilyticus]|uniref:hypothetical protein n=1 Tax=Croceicoccus gelatinilyticus TaxID=2835536 RepID=UPI001BCD917B|nr:hypothetical protein [Croceicoccus gelatinilyticus]MBS7671619.1 hypothetical protein [Croceicoccus gelatinilyticus]
MTHPTRNPVKGLITLALLALLAGVLWLIASEGSETSNLETLWAHPAREGPIVPERVAVCAALHAGLVLEDQPEAGLEEDVARTCKRAAADPSLPKACRTYAARAATVGAQAARGIEDTDARVDANELLGDCMD